jgi:hypothetical protein
MRLLGGAQVTPEPARGAIRHPPPVLLGALRPFVMPPPNARYHPPARPLVEHEIGRVAGRVHAVVRRGLAFYQEPPTRLHYLADETDELDL